MKCLSINLWNINPPVEQRMVNLYRFIMRENPDIICFQEVSLICERPQIEKILNDANYKYIYVKSGVWKGREEGLAIASHYEFKDYYSFQLPDSYSYNDMQRILLCAEVMFKGKKIYVYNTHLAYHLKSQKCREIQLQFIKDKICTPKEKRYTILCGDFNIFQQESYLINYIESELNLTDTWGYDNMPLTFSINNKYVSSELWPNRCLDHIFVSSHFKMNAKLCMCETDGNELCSDHYGVIAYGGVS